MQKHPKSPIDEVGRPRVLARLLAEDLRNLKVFGGAATTTETGSRGNDDWDITNVGGDGDVFNQYPG